MAIPIWVIHFFVIDSLYIFSYHFLTFYFDFTATRPLLRQIENLQSNFNAQSSTWEQVERNLTERLSESQTQLASATEKERMVTESALEAGSKLASLESQLALIRQEKSRLVASLEMEKAKVESLEENKHR